MVRYAIQRCCRTKSSRESISNHIWISDDVLKAQWNRFGRISRRLFTIHSQTSCRALLLRREADQPIDGAPKSRRRLVQNNDAIYQTRRHGSAAPGPLEARRRRALQRHMTGASNLGMFGTGLDFSGSSFRGSNTSSDSLYDALGMIWRWWLLDPDAPIRNEENTTPILQDSAQKDSFTSLLEDLDVRWSTKPNDIIELMPMLFATESQSQFELLQKTCTWIRAEIALGAMTEKTIKTIIWDLGEFKSLRERLARAVAIKHQILVLENIAEGILKSTIRPLMTLDHQTIWMLLRSLAVLHSQSLTISHHLSRIVELVAKQRSEQFTQMLTALLEILTAKSMVILNTTSLDLLDSLPVDVSGAIVLGMCRNLIQACKRNPDLRNSQRLQSFIVQMLEGNLLTKLREQPELNMQWYQIEYGLFKLGMPYVSTYLQYSSEQDVCVYTIRHVIEESTKLASSAQGTPLMHVYQALPDGNKTMTSLLYLVEKNSPRHIKRTLRFFFTVLRLTDRKWDFYKMSKWLYSRKDFYSRPGFEYFQEEISLWAENWPTFAVLLSATDRRAGAMHHPIVAKTLGTKSLNLNEVPDHMMALLAISVIQTHGQDRKIAALSNLKPNLSKVLMQLTFESIAESEYDTKRGFRLAQKLLKLLEPYSGTLRREFSMSCTRIVAMKSLEARCKVPKWKMIWLQHVVTHIEGPKVWIQTLNLIQQWWRTIEAEEMTCGRIWQDGVGWVEK